MVLDNQRQGYGAGGSTGPQPSALTDAERRMLEALETMDRKTILNDVRLANQAQLPVGIVRRFKRALWTIPYQVTMPDHTTVWAHAEAVPALRHALRFRSAPRPHNTESGTNGHPRCVAGRTTRPEAGGLHSEGSN